MQKLALATEHSEPAFRKVLSCSASNQIGEHIFEISKKQNNHSFLAEQFIPRTEINVYKIRNFVNAIFSVTNDCLVQQAGRSQYITKTVCFPSETANV